LQHTFTASICHQYDFKTLVRIAISVVNHGASLTDAATLAKSLALLSAAIQMGDFVVSCTVGLDK
jgi:ribonuclease PH